MKLTPQSSSVHAHSTFCDGKQPLEEMLAAAYEAGVRYYGASSHSHTPTGWDVGETLPEEPTEYRQAVLKQREIWKGRMEVLLGIELDSTSGDLPGAFDYWIGSVHYLQGADGRYYPLDWDKPKLTACLNEAFGGDGLAMTDAYYKEVAAMARRKPTVLGHIDLITKLNGDGEFFDEADPRYRAAALEALHAVDPAATLLEINTGAMSRKHRTEPYPAPFLLEEWYRMGGRVIITGDVHHKDHMVYAYDQAAEAARAAGFSEASVLTLDGEKTYQL